MKKDKSKIPIEVITHGNRIVSAIDNHLHIKAEEIMGRSRRSEIVSARSILFAIMTHECNFQVVDTASFVNMDHASVLHNLKTHRDLYETNHKDYKANFLHIKEEYYNIEKELNTDQDESLLIKVDFLINEMLKIKQLIKSKIKEKQKV